MSYGPYRSGLGFLPRLSSDGWSEVPGLRRDERAMASICAVIIATPGIGNYTGMGTGFLVAPRVVCTAAHVVKQIPSRTIQAEWLRCLWGSTVNKGGETPTNRLPLYNRVIDVRVNPGYLPGLELDYNPATANLQDLALLLLGSEPPLVDGVTPEPIRIGSAPGPGVMALAVGYGPSEADRLTDLRRRRSGAVYVTHSTETVIVTRYPATEGYEYAGQTSGDSGGPLIVPSSDGLPLAVGVVCGYRGVTVPQTFELYTKLDAARSWIESVMDDWGSSAEQSDVSPGPGSRTTSSAVPVAIGLGVLGAILGISLLGD